MRLTLGYTRFFYLFPPFLTENSANSKKMYRILIGEDQIHFFGRFYSLQPLCHDRCQAEVNYLKFLVTYHAFCEFFKN